MGGQDHHKVMFPLQSFGSTVAPIPKIFICPCHMPYRHARLCLDGLAAECCRRLISCVNGSFACFGQDVSISPETNSAISALFFMYILRFFMLTPQDSACLCEPNVPIS